MPKKYIQTAGGSTPGKAHLHPPTHCDLCQGSIQEVFYDAATRSGTWGNFCPACAELFQIFLGPGRGQQYTLQEVPDEPMHHPFSIGAVLNSKP
jgi:hypothetical protein